MLPKKWSLEEGEKVDTNQIRFVNCEFDIKALHDDDEEEGRVEGFASVFKNIDLVGDIVDAGAFAKTLKENEGKVPILSNHNIHKQIGFGTEGEEKKKGLFVKGILEVKSIPEAQAHFALMKRAHKIQAKSGLSFAFTVVDFSFNRETGIRHLKELKLHEWSPVTFPANPKAQVTAAKMWNEFYADACEETLDVCVASFIDMWKAKGHTDIEIYEALNRAAVSEEPSSSIAHSFDEGIQDLKKLLSQGGAK